jgi:hypothetical protein
LETRLNDGAIARRAGFPEKFQTMCIQSPAIVPGFSFRERSMPPFYVGKNPTQAR